MIPRNLSIPPPSYIAWFHVNHAPLSTPYSPHCYSIHPCTTLYTSAQLYTPLHTLTHPFSIPMLPYTLSVHYCTHIHTSLGYTLLRIPIHLYTALSTHPCTPPTHPYATYVSLLTTTDHFHIPIQYLLYSFISPSVSPRLFLATHL